ncbi:MAG: hypothetical protein HPY59_00865 [Anaerolineae bacterium]|nr:hypothetical protein [Anaerolineae bacterium]
MAERSLTQKGIAALKQGNRAEAYRFLAAAAQKNPRDEMAWLGLASCLDEPGKKRFCLQKVLAINPKNTTARRLLARLETSAPSLQAAPGAAVPPPQPPAPAASSSAEPERPPETQLREQLLQKSPSPRTSAGAKPPRGLRRRRRILLPVLILLFLAAAAGVVGWWVFASGFQPLAWVRGISGGPTPATAPEGEAPAATALPTEVLPPDGDPGFQQLQQFGNGLILDMALTPDGRQLVLATSLGIALYDLDGWLEGGAPALVRQIPTTKAATSLAISPDGGRVAAILETDPQDEQEIIIWSLADGERQAKMDTARRLQNGQPVYDPVDARVAAILFSPDGGQLIGRKSPLVVWNAEDGSFVESGPTGWSNGRLVFSPDGSHAAACEDVEVVLWDAADQPARVFPVSPAALPGGCGGLAFSPDGRWLASVSAGGAVDLWNLQSGERLDLPGSILEGEETPPGLSAAFSPGGESLAAGFSDRILLWRPASPGAPRTIPALEPPEKLLFTSDGGHLLTLGQGVLRLWNLNDLNLIATLPGYENYASAAVSPARQMIAVALPEGRVRLRRVQDGADLALLGNAQALTALGFSPDSRRLAVYSDRLEIWQTGGGMEYALEVQGDFQALNPDWKSYLALDGKTIRQFTLPEGAESWSKSFAEDVQHAVYAHSDVVIVAAGQNYHFLQAGDGQELYALPAGNAIDQVAYSPDRRYLAYARDLDATIWQAADGAQLASFPLDDNEASFDFTNDSRFLAVSDRSGLHLVNPSDGSETFFLERCSGAMFSANSSSLVCYDPTGDRIRLLPVYQLSGRIELGSEVSNPAGLGNHVARWIFLPEKGQLLIFSYDGTARLWKIP